MDVYSNEYITSKIQFMDASASIAKIDTGLIDLFVVAVEPESCVRFRQSACRNVRYRRIHSSRKVKRRSDPKFNPNV